MQACDIEESNLTAAELFPSNQTTQSKFYLKINQKFFDDKFKYLENLFMINKEEKLSKVKRVYEECPYVHDSKALKNFYTN